MGSLFSQGRRPRGCVAPVRIPRNLHLYFFLPTSCQQQSVLSVLLEFPQNPLPLQGKRMLRYSSNIMLLAQNRSFLLFTIFFPAWTCPLSLLGSCKHHDTKPSLFGCSSLLAVFVLPGSLLIKEELYHVK